MSIVNQIKDQVKKSGTNKGKFLYFRPGTKVRIRFLVDMDAGYTFTFHDSFERSINTPCQELFGRNCPYCGDDGLRTRDQYCWPVWDYDAKEVKLLLAPVNNCSPIPALVAMYDTYGTLLDRDYVITKQGSQQNTTFSVVPMDKVKFRNDKAKALSESQILKLLDKAFPCDEATEEKPVKKSRKPVVVEEDDDDEDEVGNDYESMTAKELYALCVEKGIDVKPKKDKSFYIEQLEAYESDDDEDWDDDEEVDDWDE